MFIFLWGCEIWGELSCPLLTVLYPLLELETAQPLTPSPRTVTDSAAQVRRLQRRNVRWRRLWLKLRGLRLELRRLRQSLRHGRNGHGGGRDGHGRGDGGHARAVLLVT